VGPKAVRYAQSRRIFVAGDSIEPFPFDGRSFPVIETYEVWLASVDARALTVDLRPGKLRGTDVDMVILRLVSHGKRTTLAA
jgi:hypothetical protein